MEHSKTRAFCFGSGPTHTNEEPTDIDASPLEFIQISTYLFIPEKLFFTLSLVGGVKGEEQGEEGRKEVGGRGGERKEEEEKSFDL